MTRLLPLLILLAAVAPASTPAFATEPVLAGRGTAPPRPIEAATLLALPQHTATAGTHTLSGPLLWDVLVAAALVDPARHGDVPRQTLRLAGADGYVAVLAVGELSPEFENKPAVLALTLDGQPLDRPRATIPGDKRGGRGVHDVAAITLEELPNGKR